jgi:hypothetical protein
MAVIVVSLKLVAPRGLEPRISGVSPGVLSRGPTPFATSEGSTLLYPRAFFLKRFRVGQEPTLTAAPLATPRPGEVASTSSCLLSTMLLEISGPSKGFYPAALIGHRSAMPAAFTALPWWRDRPRLGPNLSGYHAKCKL